ncbi:MAG: glycosyltransferase [Negativicutes bacterium]|nr:glycosyltransferase [Negativicutes bacterium]
MSDSICHMLPYFRNVHILKDNGLIPYYMSKKYDMEAWIVGYGILENMEYNQRYLNSTLQFFSLGEKEHKENLQQVIQDGERFLYEHATKIKVLYLFGLDAYNFAWINFYKHFNPNGKVYLKIDGARHNVRMRLNEVEIAILSKVELISIESKELFEKLKMFWPVPVQHIPNGFFMNNALQIFEWGKKENIILTVGRLGTKQKATEILMEAFALADHYILADWKLQLVGPVDDSFKIYIVNFFKRYPELKERIIFVGNIYERELLEELYGKAKLFCLSSRWEGFPLVFPDALRHGCYIVSTDFASAYDITNDEVFGDIVPIDDIAGLAYSFVKAVAKETLIGAQSLKRQQYAQEYFSWERICEDIFKGLKL